MMRFGKVGFVLPNGFDETTRRVSSAALAARRQAGEAKLQRIGYAGGTRTHQKDFATIAAPIAAVLRQAAHRRLVLFRRAGVPCVDIDEFPELTELAPQIEWRDMVGLDELPWELVRFDVNLAPLEVGNPYCEAKSELKFFEAALVGVPTVASPTQPFRDAMRHGETGFLASAPETWFAHITALLSDETLRQRVVQAALVEVEARYGVAKRVETLVEMMQHLS
jgi:glycosyltransferase involved in cell wall biosynthesis